MNYRRFALAAFMTAAIVPGLALAAGNGVGPGGGGSTGGGQSSGTQDRDQDRDRIQDPATHTGDEPLQTRDQDRDRLYQTTSTVPIGGGSMNQNQQGGAGPSGPATGTPPGPGYGAQTQYRLQIDPEHLQIRAGDPAQFGEMVRTRAIELNGQASATPASDRNAMQNANRMRLGVYSVLAAGGLMQNGVGPQIADLANQVNASIQTTAGLEAQVDNRSLLSRIFFGGDKSAGETLASVANDNRARIESMSTLLAQSNLPDAVRAELQTQLDTMRQEQDRLLALGDHEQRQWGIFSWRTWR